MTENKTSLNLHQDITLEELVRSELQGKDMAIERYDSILWKIRSGYVTILYGAISLLGGAISQFGREIQSLPWLALALIWGFSICAFIIDRGFLRSKIQVVIAKDKLVDISQQLAAGANNTQFNELSVLLHNSGEDPTFPFKSDVHKYLWSWSGAGSVLILYAITPIVGTIISVLLAIQK